jgi:hypothetical protein
LLASIAGLLAITGLAWLAWLAVDTWLLGRRPAAAVLAILYRRLVRQGQRLAVPVQASNTPAEFAAAFERRLAELQRNARRPDQIEPDGAEARQIAEAYAAAIYSSHPPPNDRRGLWIRLSQRLHRRLWWIRYARPGLGKFIRR